MTHDLSRHHRPITDLFSQSSGEELKGFCLTDDQVSFFKEYGYLKSVPMLDEHQVDVLRNELDELVDPNHPGRELFYEYNSNESKEADRVLFHALGAWRVTPGFH